MQGVHVGDAEGVGRGQDATGQRAVGGQHVGAPALYPGRCARLIRLVNLRAARVEHLSQIPAGPPVRGRIRPYVQYRCAQPELREAAGQDRRDLLQSARIQHAGDDQAPRPGQITIATRAWTDGGRRPGRSRAGGRKWAVEGSARPRRAGSGTDQRCGPGVNLRRRTQLVVPRDQSAERARRPATGRPVLRTSPAPRAAARGMGCERASRESALRYDTRSSENQQNAEARSVPPTDLARHRADTVANSEVA